MKLQYAFMNVSSISGMICEQFTSKITNSICKFQDIDSVHVTNGSKFD